MFEPLYADWRLMKNQIADENIVELEMSVPLRTTDFDCYGKIKPSAVLQLFQDVATLQAEKMGIGLNNMATQGVLWAVIRTAYEVIEQPKPYDRVSVRTWPHDPSKFSFLRDYQIKNSAGKLLVKGTSEWVLMSVDDRSFVPLFSVYEGTRDFIDERNYEKKPRKLKNFDTDGIEPLTLVPRYCTLDINGHVNNSVYADFLVDAIDPGRGYEVRSFQIDFRREVRKDETLNIYTQAIENGVQAKGIDNQGNIMFAARIEV